MFDYFPYGKKLRSYAAENEKYINTHHERDGETGLTYAGARFVDHDIGRFLSLDPKASDLPAWSSYNYLVGNPIMFVDPDGQFPITFQIRSFAPFKRFGMKIWHGDDRGFSADPNASYRTSVHVDYETDDQSSNVRDGASLSVSAYGAISISETASTNYSNGNNIKVHSYGDNDALIPPAPGTPPGSNPDWGGPTWDIDMHSDLTVNLLEDGSSQILQISGSVVGDGFPSGEALVQDAAGNSVLLGVSAAQANGFVGPFMTLAGDNKREMISIDVSIVVNGDGVFQGVKSGDQIISIEDWNKQFEEQKP